MRYQVRWACGIIVAGDTNESWAREEITRAHCLNPKCKCTEKKITVQDEATGEEEILRTMRKLGLG